MKRFALLLLMATALHFPVKMQGLFRPYRNKVMYGGRGATRSWSVARYLILRAYDKKERILCSRELQNSIAESVHQLLRDQITKLGLDRFFYITDKAIVCTKTGTNFIFKGLKSNPTEIKSMEGVTICWVEEAQNVSAESWNMLEPTIRMPGSEIIITFNTGEENDETYQRFVTDPPPNTWVEKMTYKDNPWFPPELEKLRAHLQKKDPLAYDNVWDGNPKVYGDAVIFKGRVKVHYFEAPVDPPPIRYYGADFSSGGGDPHTLMGMYITGEFPNEELWIDEELCSNTIELDELATWYKKGDHHYKGIANVAKGAVVRCDNARPDTVRLLQKGGINAISCEKGPGSVEEGINQLKAFSVINIHSINCPNQVFEAVQYRWKIDPKTKKVITPAVPVDANNHSWDADRYALEEVFMTRGVDGVWGKL